MSTIAPTPLRAGRSATSRPVPRTAGVRTWNRLHYYLGLYFLLFLWLFALSGLMLNHSGWTASQFWSRRAETTSDHPVRRPTSDGDLAMAHDLMRQLGIVGEVGEMKRHGSDAAFDFQVVKPGHTWQVKADFATGSASVKEIRVDAFGVLDVLHKFTGAKIGDRSRRPDWIWTTVWSLAMVALSVGMIVLVITGLYLWYRLPGKRRAGLVALGLGLATCGFFLFGLSWL